MDEDYDKIEESQNQNERLKHELEKKKDIKFFFHKMKTRVFKLRNHANKILKKYEKEENIDSLFNEKKKFGEIGKREKIESIENQTKDKNLEIKVKKVLENVKNIEDNLISYQKQYENSRFFMIIFIIFIIILLKSKIYGKFSIFQSFPSRIKHN